jgi:hypothetical protein
MMQKESRQFWVQQKKLVSQNNVVALIKTII